MSRDVDSFLTYFALRVPKTITKVLDRNGDVIGVFAEENRVVIPFGDIPRAFVGAVIATEDSDFMNHGGISARGVVRAGFNFITSFGQRREGASTLTMQLVRTVTAKRQRRLDRKLKEIILALKLEKAYTKKQIFEQYANEVYFGGGPLRHRGGGPVLLRQERPPAGGGGVRPARRAGPEPELVQPLQPRPQGPGGGQGAGATTCSGAWPPKAT